MTQETRTRARRSDLFRTAATVGRSTTPVQIAVQRIGAGTDEHDAAHALLRALMRHVDPAAAHLPLAYGPSGAPFLDGAERVGVSVSHDACWVAAAVAPGLRIGVDVQEPVDGSFARLARRCLRRHEDTVAQLGTPARDTELAWVWTAQEACVKAHGTGLAGRPWALDVAPFRTAGRAGRADWRALRGTAPVPLSVATADLPTDHRIDTGERETP